MVHTVIFKVTHACNLACRYCYAVDNKSKVVSRSILGSVIRASVQLDADTVNFIWHGGEPLIAGLDFFAEAVAMQNAASDGTGKRYLNGLQTNGTLVTPDIAEFFRDKQFAVGVSLDGPPHWHNRDRVTARGNGTYEQALKGYQTLRSAGVAPGVVCVIDPVDPPDAVQLVDWLEEIEADSVSLNAMFSRRAAPRGGQAIFLLNLEQELRRRRSLICVRELLFAGTTAEERDKQGILDACHPGWPCHETISTVDEEGYIYFACDRFLDKNLSERGAYRLGHIDNGGFPKALSSPRYTELASVARKDKDTCKQKCSSFGTCDGGCMADWMLLPAEQTQARPEVVYCQGLKVLSVTRIGIDA